MSAAASPTFTGQVSDFAVLISVLLIFITVLTQQRSALRQRMQDDVPLSQAIWNVVANTAIFIGTLGVALAGARLWWAGIHGWMVFPRGREEQAKALVTLTGIFFLFLLAWQAFLIYSGVGKIRPRKARLGLAGSALAAAGIVIGLYLSFHGGGNAQPSWVISARSQLAELKTRSADPKMPANRRTQEFGGWRTVGGCSTRNRILARDLKHVMRSEGHCIVTRGALNDPYTGDHITFVRGVSPSWLIQIDHVVALAAAWRTGADHWTPMHRRDFANDPQELLAVDGSENAMKSDKDASNWIPPNAAYDCAYVASQIEIKVRYKLWVTPRERTKMVKVLSDCPAGSAPPRSSR